MAENSKKARRRPFGLYMIAVLQAAIAGLLALALLGTEVILPYLKVLVKNPFFYSWAGWVLVGFLALAILGLLGLKRWGWVLTMILTGVGLSLSIWNYFQGTPNYIGLVLYVALVFYLNQREVQAAFQHKRNSGGVA